MSYTYGSLKSDVLAEGRGDLSAQVPRFVEIARRRLGRDLRVNENETSAILSSFSSGNATLPSDFAAIRNITWAGGSTYNLQSVGFDELESYVSGFPTCYAIRNGVISIRPAPSSGTATLYYYQFPPVLVNPTDTGAVLDAYGHLWLQAALIEAHRFRQAWDSYKAAIEQYQAEVDQVNTQWADARMATAPAPHGEYAFIAPRPYL